MPLCTAALWGLGRHPMWTPICCCRRDLQWCPSLKACTEQEEGQASVARSKAAGSRVVAGAGRGWLRLLMTETAQALQLSAYFRDSSFILAGVVAWFRFVSSWHRADAECVLGGM